MSKEMLFAVASGAGIGALIAACYGYYNFIDTQLSVYGGWDEHYAWDHVHYGLDRDQLEALEILSLCGALIGGTAAALGSLVASRNRQYQ